MPYRPPLPNLHFPAPLHCNTSQGKLTPSTPERSDESAPLSDGYTFRKRGRRVGSSNSLGNSARRTASPPRLEPGSRAWRTPPVKPKGDVWASNTCVTTSSSKGAVDTSASLSYTGSPPFTPKNLTSKILWASETPWTLDTLLEEEYFSSLVAQSASRVRRVANSLKAI